MAEPNISQYPRRTQVSVDAAKLWGGGVATGMGVCVWSLLSAVMSRTVTYSA